MQQARINEIYKYIFYSKRTIIEIVVAAAAGAIIYGMLFVTSYLKTIKESTVRAEQLIREQNLLMQEQNALLQMHDRKGK